MEVCGGRLWWLVVDGVGTTRRRAMTDQGEGQVAPAHGAPDGWSGRAGGRGRPGAGRPEDAPDALAEPDAWMAGRPQGDSWHADDEEQSESPKGDAALGAVAGESAHMSRVGARARQLLRGFWRGVPRREEKATLGLVHPGGSTRLVTRGELSAAIDRLRPRQRQIMRLAIEERWPRQRVCEYLRHISLKTFERDQVEALDILAQL